MDKYTVNKVIGEGSFGKAILVKNKCDGEQYVVKEIGISKMKPKEKDEARKEVTVLSKMRHPNIVQYTESFEENGKLYIVMEYCEGGDLYALINKQKGIPFKEQQVLNWFVQLCLALKHVHDRKILHRDIKTSNIFLTKSGTIKLGDFGIARVLNNTMELARTCIGTPYYLSPEICENKPYNNKSDVWALGCVVYEALTLKHAFEAGNMKNLVLKIIRGSYPPIPSRYSYDLRTMVSHLFRRNPRERPSINSILRKPFLATLTEQFLTPQQHEEEFSHTVLHKGKPKPSAYKPPHGARYQPVGVKRMQNLEVRGGAFGVRNRRDQQIAAAYGPSVVAKKPKPIASRASKASHDKEDYLEKKRKQLMEEEKRRKNALNEEKKKRLEDLQKRQRERAIKLKQEQLKRARDEARVMNLKRSAELWDPKANGEPDVNLKKQIMAANAGRDRPVSAPRERGDYDKYHEYLNKMESGDRNAAANVAAPGLNRVKDAWDERQKNQAAILAAKVNRDAGEKAAERAQVVSDFLQRKKEAAMYKHRGDAQMHKNLPYKRPNVGVAGGNVGVAGANVGVAGANVGVAGALKPYSAASDRVGHERDYLSRLQQIRQQNYHERKILHQKYMDNKNAYKVEISESDDREGVEEWRKKVLALQQHAADRAKLLQENIGMRRNKLDADEHMKEHDAKARARGIVPPDERPVKYNPNPISITQALHAVGAPIAQKSEGPNVDEMLSPSRADPKLKKKVLQRVNQRFSIDCEDEAKPESDKENNKDDENTDKTAKSRQGKVQPRPLPDLPENAESGAEERPKSAWQVRKDEGDILNELLGLPLQDTKALEGTAAPEISAAPLQPDVKRHWQPPSGTFVRQLNQMTLQNQTLTVADKSSDATTERPLPKLKSMIPAEKPEITDSVPSKETASDISSTISEKTVVLKKTSIDTTATSSDKKIPERLLAANFRPTNKNGTYVISSLDVAEQTTDKQVATKKEDRLSLNLRGAAKSPATESPAQSSAASGNKNDEMNNGNPVKNADVSDDIEEVEMTNEVTTSIKADPNLTAWSDEKQVKAPSKPPEGEPKSLEPAEKENSTISKSPSPLKSFASPKPSLSSSPPVRSNRSSYSQDTLKLSGSTLDKSATKSGSTSGSANRLLFSSINEKLSSTNEKPSFSNEKPPSTNEKTPSTNEKTPSTNEEPPSSNEKLLFTKINRNKDESASSTPNRQAENLDKSDPSPSSKSFYTTANDHVLMKLTLGGFDSPNPKLLRTCSLPDLNSISKNSQEDGEDPGNHEDDDFKDISAMQSMNDTNFDDGEEEDDKKSKKKSPDAEDTDEEELSEFCANLQSVLDNSSKPDSSSHPFGWKLSDSMDAGRDDSSSDDDDQVRINEDWQSDSDSESSSTCSDDISDTESVFSRLEDNREELERELGLEKFKRAYRYVQAIHEDEDESVRECQDRIRAVLGGKHDALYPKILQLVMADGAYCEDNS